MNIRVKKDGDSWCVLEGDNLQDGIGGFGNTKIEAWMDYIDHKYEVDYSDELSNILNEENYKGNFEQVCMFVSGIEENLEVDGLTIPQMAIIVFYILKVREEAE